MTKQIVNTFKLPKTILNQLILSFVNANVNYLLSTSVKILKTLINCFQII